MAVKRERWPPVYDADDLVREIKRLTPRSDLATAFYEWRRDLSLTRPDDVCQGDVVQLRSGVPVILEDGQPATMEHPGSVWLVVGNTCDFDRELSDVRWTQLGVPIISVGTATELSLTELAAVRKYTQSRSFYVPPWTSAAPSP